MRLRLRHAALAATAAFSLAACYPDDITDASQLDTVTTLYDNKKDFGSLGTYVLLDTIVFIDADGSGGDDESDISHAFDDEILSAVRRNMNTAGYTELPASQTAQADLTVQVAATSQTTVGFVYDWWYYWGWYPYWPGYAPGWGWGYPPVSVAYAYQTGTLLMAILDTKHGDPTTERIPVVWLGAVNGVLTGSAQLSRITDGIDQAFKQSPYLRT